MSESLDAMGRRRPAVASVRREYTLTCIRCEARFKSRAHNAKRCEPCRSTPEPKPSRPCDVCGADASRLYCSVDCRLEANARKNRDRYRASVGLPVDWNRATSPRRREFLVA